VTEDSRAFIKELSQMECQMVRSLTDGTLKLSPDDEAVLRWALSLARVSRVLDPNPIEIGHATDIYRTKLYDILRSSRNIAQIKALISSERAELLSLFKDKLSSQALDAAVQTRPLALALGGGGGTSFIFAGAFQALEEAGIIPDAIAGSSMGAFLGLYRAKTKHFNLEDLKRLASPLVWSRITQSSEQGSRFGLPATFRLNLHSVFGSEFGRDDRTLYLSELEIPLRVTVAGIADADVEELPDTHWLESNKMEAAELKKREQSIVQTLLQIAKKPLKAIYLGSDELTRDFDVLDAVGFSGAVPGLFHYDVLRNDPHMVPLIRELMHQQGVSRFIDGGFADNLPAAAAGSCLTDPFILALDGFAPNWKRHWLFLPMMRIAAENSKKGYETAHLTIAYQHVLSPINIVPSQKELDRTIEHGRQETQSHIAFIKKMLGPIPNPFADKLESL
jgi:predicted acylesterase/phospholipase RssA